MFIYYYYTQTLKRQKMHALLIHTRTAFVNINICNPFGGFSTDGNFCIRKNVSGKET